MTELIVYTVASDETPTTMTAGTIPAIQQSDSLLQSLGGNYDPLKLSRHIAETTAELILFLAAERSIEEFLAFSKLLADPEVIEAYIDKHTVTLNIQRIRLSLWERITGRATIKPDKTQRQNDISVNGLESYHSAYDEFQNAFREKRAKVQQSTQLQQQIMVAQNELESINLLIEQKLAQKKEILRQRRKELADLRRETGEINTTSKEKQDDLERFTAQKRAEIEELLAQAGTLKKEFTEPFRQLWEAHLAKTTEAYLESFPEHLRGEVRQLLTGTHGPRGERETFLSTTEVGKLNKVFSEGYFSCDMDRKEYNKQRKQILGKIQGDALKTFPAQLTTLGFTSARLDELIHFILDAKEKEKK